MKYVDPYPFIDNCLRPLSRPVPAGSDDPEETMKYFHDKAVAGQQELTNAAIIAGVVVLATSLGGWLYYKYKNRGSVNGK